MASTSSTLAFGRSVFRKVGRRSEPSEETAAIVSGAPSVLHDGDRVYVGAWSRLTVRLG